MSKMVSSSSRFGEVVLWLAMLAAVGVCAAGSYEHLIIVPEWTKAPPDSIAMFHGPYAMDTGRFWRVVHVPTLLSCLVAFALLRGHPRRRFVGAPLIGYALVLVVTVVWFLPELMTLIGDPGAAISPSEWKSRAERWEVASLARLFVMYVNAGLLVWAAAARPGSLVPARASSGVELASAEHAASR